MQCSKAGSFAFAVSHTDPISSVTKTDDFYLTVAIDSGCFTWQWDSFEVSPIPANSKTPVRLWIVGDRDVSADVWLSM